jgi:Radical SAM superfamily
MRQDRVLLLDLYLLEIDAVVREDRPFAQPYLYLGAFLEQLGVEHDIYRWYGPADELTAQVKAGGYGFVFVNLIIGPVLARVEPACRLIRETSPDTKIWVGGLAVHFVREMLEASPHIDHVSSGNPMRDPQGFAAELIEQGVICASGSQSAHFPVPSAYSQLARFVHEHDSDGGPLRTLNMTTACWCRNSCAFCYLRRAGVWRWPVGDLMDELVRLHGESGVCHLEYSDDNFAADSERLVAYAAGMARVGLHLPYHCLCSVDSLTEESLDVLESSGMRRVFVGVDAIHTRGLDLFRKAFTREDVFEAIGRLRSRRVDLTLAVVLGAFGETRDEVQELYDWVMGVAPEICAPQLLTPYPGTPLFTQAVAHGFVPPQSLEEWAVVGDQRRAKACSCQHITLEEYWWWYKAFQKLGTRRYRSGIGETMRRLKRRPADEKRSAERTDSEIKPLH